MPNFYVNLRGNIETIDVFKGDIGMLLKLVNILGPLYSYGGIVLVRIGGFIYCEILRAFHESEHCEIVF